MDRKQIILKGIWITNEVFFLDLEAIVPSVVLRMTGNRRGKGECRCEAEPRGVERSRNLADIGYQV